MLLWRCVALFRQLLKIFCFVFFLIHSLPPAVTCFVQELRLSQRLGSTRSLPASTLTNRQADIQANTNTRVKTWSDNCSPSQMLLYRTDRSHFSLIYETQQELRVSMITWSEWDITTQLAGSSLTLITTRLFWCATTEVIASFSVLIYCTFRSSNSFFLLLLLFLVFFFLDLSIRLESFSSCISSSSTTVCPYSNYFTVRKPNSCWNLSFTLNCFRNITRTVCYN